MRRVLFLAYNFPPIGGSGVQRNVKFARYLVEHGYQPVIVTGTGDAEDYWRPRDDTLAAELPPEVEVHRVPGPEPAISGRWRHRAERWLRLPAPEARWWLRGAGATALEVAGEAELVYAALAPYETAIPAARLAATLGRPWIADLQDPWALDEIWFYPTGLHRRLDLARMRRLLTSAERVVMNSPEAELRMRARFPALSPRLVTIPNGYDAEDFAGPDPPRAPGDPFRIVHTGYLYTQIGRRHRRVGPLRRVLGGAPAAVDVLTRTHVYLLEALAHVRADNPELAADVELHLAGVLSEEDRQVADRDPTVRLHGYLPHAGAVALMRTADLLFLPLHDVAPGARVGIVPGKTYEYLAANRPILAAVPPGDARDLLEAAGNASICDPRDVAAMAAAITRALARRRASGRFPAPDPDVLARYERRALTAALARTFDDATKSSS